MNKPKRFKYKLSRSGIYLLAIGAILIFGATLSGCIAAAWQPPQAWPLPTASMIENTPIIRRTPAAPNSFTSQTISTPTAPWQQSQETYLGIWLTQEELASLPISGPAWDQLKAAADQDPGKPDLADKDQMNNVYVLAKALVYARTGEPEYRDQVIDNLMAAMGTEDGGRTLAVARNLAAYVIAADLVNLPLDADRDQVFRTWLRELLTKPLDGMTLQQTHEERPNNWGTHAGASRAAIALYLGDDLELERTAQVFKGWLGDRDIYAGFAYGKLYWQADPKRPVGINPAGAEKDGHSIDGALPEEMRRGGRFRWPPKKTNYPWGALQGALVQAELLQRAGYPAWEWEDKALLRAVQFLYNISWEPEGDDEWQPWLVNQAYGTAFPIIVPARPGKNIGWTDWTHSEYRQLIQDTADSDENSISIPELD